MSKEESVTQVCYYEEIKCPDCGGYDFNMSLLNNQKGTFYVGLCKTCSTRFKLDVTYNKGKEEWNCIRKPLLHLYGRDIQRNHKKGAERQEGKLSVVFVYLDEQIPENNTSFAFFNAKEKEFLTVNKHQVFRNIAEFDTICTDTAEYKMLRDKIPMWVP
jgi:hypothetical protein